MSTVKTKRKTLDGTTVACPVCQLDISALSPDTVQLHVNGCLDVAVLEGKKKFQLNKSKRQRTTVAPVKIKQEEVPHFNNMFLEIEDTPLEPEPSFNYTYNIPENNVSTNGSATNKSMPSYKQMPGTNFTVDAFRYGNLDFCTGYFLTHFHSDHYGGLAKTKFLGHIYCSRITANCVISKIGISPNQVHPLPMNTRCLVQGVYVTLIDAEHCPGAAIILFEVPSSGDDGKEAVTRVVHTGDFRASRQHVDQILRVFSTPLSKPVLPDMLMLTKPLAVAEKQQIVEIDYLYLDTTYLEPTYSFPLQSQVISAVGEFCSKINADSSFLPGFMLRFNNNKKDHQSPNKKTKLSLITNWFAPRHPKKASVVNSFRSSVLFVVGSYSIGKEKLFVEIARRLQSRIYVASDKKRMLECLGSTSLLNMLTTNQSRAQVHVVSMNQVNVKDMTEYLRQQQQLMGSKSKFTSIVAFSPTGWSHSSRYKPKNTEGLLIPPPRLVSQAELENKELRLVKDMLAKSAHLNDDRDLGDFTMDKLKPRNLSPNNVTIFPVPYSEHSSFAELARFICSLRVKQVVSTVVSSTAAKNQLADSWIQHWQELKQTYELWHNSPTRSASSSYFEMFGYEKADIY